MSDLSAGINKMRTAYKVRAYPNNEQATLLRRTFGCVRVVWNKALADRRRRYTLEQKSTSYKETDAALSTWKKTENLSFLSAVSSVPLQQTLRHQHAAFTSFFTGSANYPRFKNRHGRQSAHFTRSAFRIKPNGLWLAKTSAPLRVAWSWPDIDPATLNPTMVIVSLEPDGRWFVTFAVDGKAAEVLPTTERSVGVDLGVQDFAVLSNGERIGNPHHVARHERGLRRHQKRLARLQKGSRNRAKQREKLARKHSRIRDARRDFLHKTSTGLVKRYDTIAVEDLNVSGMIRNQRLAKSISESGWAEFRSMIAYKAERAGRQLVVIDRWYPSSKTCSACKHVLTTLPLGTRHWTCPSCGTWHDRDHNAAKNILVAAGLAETRNACGGDVRPQGFSLGQSPVKQELHDVSHGIPVLRGGE